jgi:hypothetical protein
MAWATIYLITGNELTPERIALGRVALLRDR